MVLEDIKVYYGSSASSSTLLGTAAAGPYALDSAVIASESKTLFLKIYPSGVDGGGFDDGNGSNTCYGIDDPSGNITANTDTVYYNRKDGKCYINTSVVSGTTWSSDPADFISAGISTISNNYYLSPLTYYTKAQAATNCQISDSIVNTREIGASITSSSSGCNSSKGGALTYYDVNLGPDLLNDVFPGMLDTGNASAIRSVISGSLATSSCSSMFGVQDMIGNMAEWSLDTLNCDAVGGTSGGYGCDSSSNTNTFAIAGVNQVYDFDGTVAGAGPEGDANNLDRWIIEDETYSAVEFFFAVGLPAITGTSYDTSVVASYTSELHGDMIKINAEDGTATAVMSYGGSYVGSDCSQNYSQSVCAGADCTGASSPDTVVTAAIGSIYWDSTNSVCYINSDGATDWDVFTAVAKGNGRYNLEVYPSTTSSAQIGFRCVVPVSY